MAKFYYGGQAVTEGVMMRGQRHMAVAVRAPDGKIVLHEEPLNSAIYKNPVMKLPLLRGLVALWDALGLGMRALMFSANVALDEGDETQDDRRPTTDDRQMTAKSANAKPQNSLGATAGVSVAIALVLMVGIFFVLPVLAAKLITSIANSDSTVVSNIVEAVIRLGLFLGYIWVIGYMPDIKRVFGYHGA